MSEMTCPHFVREADCSICTADWPRCAHGGFKDSGDCIHCLRAELARKDERIAELEGELRSCCVRVDEFKAYISSTANGTARITEKLRDSGFKSPWIEVAIDNVLSELAAARQEIADLQATFDLRWKADMRAIAMWRAQGGPELVMPDHADLVVWLLQQLDETRRKPFRN